MKRYCTHYTLYTTHYTLHTTHYKLHTTHCTLHTTYYTLHTTNYTPTYLFSKFTSPNLSLYTILQCILCQIQSNISPSHQPPFSRSHNWNGTVSSQSRMFLVSYNLYPGLIQDDLGGPPAQESIQSDPALADQSSAVTYEPGLRFIQDWGGTHIGFLFP